jgi:mono/diheme cytochrome c family protein
MIPLILSLLLPAASGAEAELKLQAPGRTHSVILKELKGRLPSARFEVDDPVYKRKKLYEGFWLKDLLKLTGLGEVDGDEIAFQCADGYTPSMPLALLARQKGMLAFRDVKNKAGWEKLRQGKALISPAPFYVVWDTKDEAYPWPYQVVGIEVIQFKKKYDRIYPEDETKTSAVFRGFDRFRSQCLRCHSLNLQGGDLGPELNVPRNITEYWDEGTLKEFIRDASKFRARSKMPPFPQLKDEELEQLLEYLKWMKGHKKDISP